MAAYGTDQGFADYLASMGYVLPAGAPAPIVLRTRGSAYIDATYEVLWTGVRKDGVMQDLGWERTGATLNCVTPIPDDVIPPAVVNASYRAAWLEANTAGVLAGTASSGQRIKRQKVDVIEREFFDDGAAEAGSGAGSFIDPEIDGAMRQFICDAEEGAGPFMFTIGAGRCC